MKMTQVALTAVLAITLLAGCGKKEEANTSQAQSTTSQENTSSSSATLSVDPAKTRTLSGTILFEGVAPEPKMLSVKGNPECAALHQGGQIPSEDIVVKDGKLKNVIVYVKHGLENYQFATPQTPVEIDNKQCIYNPHVSTAMVGQEVQFINRDSTLHNIHAYAKNSKSFNLGLPIVGMKQSKKIDSPELAIALKCDVHPWMVGYLAVFNHPYSVVSKEDGSFSLANLPEGKYLIEAWHEKLGVREQEITITAGQTSTLEFKFAQA